jgi:hypothetical protein
MEFTKSPGYVKFPCAGEIDQKILKDLFFRKLFTLIFITRG